MIKNIKYHKLSTFKLKHACLRDSPLASDLAQPHRHLPSVSRGHPVQLDGGVGGADVVEGLLGDAAVAAVGRRKDGHRGRGDE